MCDAIGKAYELSRRQLLQTAGVAAAAAGLGAVAPATALARGKGRVAGRGGGDASRYRSRLILLGVAGGPVWLDGVHGIGSALVVDGSVYVVDCGDGVWQQLKRANLSGNPSVSDAVADLRAVFLTHLHSDHSVDYNNLLLLGSANGLLPRNSDPVHVYGPGDRGSLPPVFGAAPAPPVIHPENPTPGTEDLTELLYAAFAQDLNDRMRDSRFPDPHSRIAAHDIPLPDGIVAGANVDPAPDMDPFDVFEDERVKVTAILVNHRPTFPSFAYRFDTDDGAVVFSGDTAPEPNLVKLARGADVLVHECIDRRWVEGLFPDPNDPMAAALVNHLLSSHTTIEQVGPIGEDAGVATLVLSHLVPATNPRRRWMDAGANFSGRLVVGEDLLQVGVGARRG